MTNSQKMLAFVIYSDIKNTIKNGIDILEYMEYMSNFVVPVVVD